MFPYDAMFLQLLSNIHGLRDWVTLTRLNFETDGLAIETARDETHERAILKRALCSDGHGGMAGLKDPIIEKTSLQREKP